MVLGCRDMQPAAISSLCALHVAITPVACWFGFRFSARYFVLYTVPDAWRLWAGPSLLLWLDVGNNVSVRSVVCRVKILIS